MLKPKYFLYARKSTEDDDHQIMSIEAQLFELREYARRENLEILCEFQESKSAKKPGREKFGEMINLVERSDGVGILAWHPDRLARNSVDGGKVIYLVDIGKIVSLRFPTFWFEPTPQGLFMLQVAFGQSKYYSDNLVENINRGIRQKLRRGEWLTKAPFGYVNNPKTRDIEPHPTLSKIVVKSFEEFATGNHTFDSLAQFLAELGVETKNRTPLAKASVQRMLTNRAYLGLVKHKGEYHDGRFAPILSSQLFEAVQKVLARRSRPRKSRERHDFPFTGLFTCGECGSAITAQFSRGKSGKLYRHYRCTKKRGVCSQKYLQEKHLAAQLKERLQKVAVRDEWTDRFIRKIDEWERDENISSRSFVQNLEARISENGDKLDKLVSSYIDGDIPKESYLKKKEELLTEKASLAQQKSDFGQNGKNRLQPLRSFILDTKKAHFLASSEDYRGIKSFIQRVGTDTVLLDASVSFSFASPFHLALRAKERLAAAHARGAAPSATDDRERLVLWTYCSLRSNFFPTE